MTGIKQKDSTGNIAVVRVLDSAGDPWTGVAYNETGLEIYYTPLGGTPVQITLSSGNWTETKHGHYEIDVPDAAYQQTAPLTISGAITDGVVIPDSHFIVDHDPVESVQDIQDTVEAITPSDATLAKQDAILAAIAALEVGTGTGPNEITITIEDQDETAVQAVTVGVYDSGVLAAISTTDADGQITINLADRTYSVRAWKSGYQFTTQSLTAPVVGDDPTYTITRLTPTPSTEPDTVTVRYRCHGSDRLPVAGVAVSMQVGAIPDGDVGNTWSDTAEQQSSDEAGWVYFTDVPVGARCHVQVSDGEWRTVTIPGDADEDGVVDVTSLLG
jgi:hypothetical protein